MALQLCGTRFATHLMRDPQRINFLGSCGRHSSTEVTTFCFQIRGRLEGGIANVWAWGDGAM